MSAVPLPRDALLVELKPESHRSLIALFIAKGRGSPSLAVPASAR